MEDAEDLHAVVAKAVGDNVRQAGDDEFAGPGYAAGPAPAGVVREPGDNMADPFYDGEGGIGFVRHNVVGDGDEIALGGRGPLDDHRPRCRPLMIRPRAALSASSWGTRPP